MDFDTGRACSVLAKGEIFVGKLEDSVDIIKLIYLESSLFM